MGISSEGHSSAVSRLAISIVLALALVATGCSVDSDDVALSPTNDGTDSVPTSAAADTNSATPDSSE